jgi:DNA repair exonuclease SbcCD ATPase subunit
MPELKIIISAENQKALEELKQLQDKLFQLQELVKNYKGDWPLTHTIETKIPELQAKIAALQASLTKAGVAFDNFGNDTGKIAIGSNKAGQALNDLSRIAQDAPYGFIGISNNLNPMLESFQRLKTESGSTSAALKAMATSLMGPAGIGLAIGVVSSLLVVFGDKLFKSSEASKEATQKAKEHADAIKEDKQAIDQIYSSVAKEQTQVISLIAVLDNENESRNRKLKALEALKKINPEIFSGLTLENNVVNGLNSAYEKYINNLNAIILLKIKQKELEEITEQILKKTGAATTQEQKDIEATGKKLKEAADKNKTDAQLRKEALDDQIKKNKEQVILNGLLEQQRKIIEQIKDVSKGIEIQGEYSPAKAAKKIKSPVKLISDGVYDASLETKSRDQLKDTDFVNQTPQAANIGTGSLFGMFDDKSKGKINTTKNELAEFLKKTKDGFKQANEAAHQFSENMAGGITNSLQGAFDALMKGENVFEALSQSVLKFAEDIVFAIIKAQLLAAIQGTIAISSGGAGAAAGGTGIFDIIMGLMGVGQKHAAGGIVSSPQIGMIGEAGPEAIMPLSKLGSFLNTSFNAGSMSGGNSSNGGQFVIRGQDLLLSVNRSQKASRIKGQSISLG